MQQLPTKKEAPGGALLCVTQIFHSEHKLTVEEMFNRSLKINI